jgi:RHS repeat-associated protein
VAGQLGEFAAAPDGTIWFLGGGNGIHKLYPNIPVTSATVSDIILASQDGSEVYVFDGRGKHLKTLDALTGVTTQTFGYDLAGFLVTITDRSGNVTTINRDSAENPISIVSPYGQTTTLQIGGDGYLASITNPANESWSLMQYQSGGLLTQLADARGGLHTFGYDNNGFLSSDTNPLFETITLDRHGTLDPDLVTHNSPMGRTWTYAVTTTDDGTQTIKRTDPAGLQETMTVGSDFKTTSATPDGMSTSVSAAGDPRFGLNNSQYPGLWTAATPGGLVLSGSANKSAVLANPSDALTLSSLLESTTINGRSATAAYTAANNTIAFTSAGSRKATLTLDTLGRVASISPPGGILPIQFHYDALGRTDTITQGTRVTTYGFGPAGYLNSVTDAAGDQTLIVNDAIGRPTQATQPDLTTIAMSYDPNGNVISVTPPGRPAHAFSYDLADEETLYTPPDAGVPMSTSTAYNPDKQAALVSRPDGDAITPGYDGATGRLTTLTTAVEQATFGYSPDGGQLTSISKPAESLTYAYDGSLLTKVTWSGDVSGVLTRSYDNSFRIQSETVGGMIITYTYDNDDLLTDAGEISIPRDPTTGFVGTGPTLGTLQEASTYDAYGELATYTVAKASTEIVYKVDYGVRDQLGRVVDKTEIVGGQVHSYHYGYDVNGRLVDVFNDGIAPGSTAWSATTSYRVGALVSFETVEYQSLLNGNSNQQPNISPISWALTHAYAYDPNGNRLIAPSLTSSPAYDAQDRLISYGNCIYGYKRVGSLQTKTCPEGTTTYDYDAFGNLRHVGLPNGTVIDYVIDGQNRRVGKKVNGVMVEGFLYRSQVQPAAWLNGDGTIKAVFVYGLKPNVPEYMIKDGLKYRLIADQLGSPRLIVDISTGTVVERIDYDEFGNLLSDTAPGTQPFTFAGGRTDLDTGLVRFGARDYAPSIGRWTASDPIRFDAGDTNLFGYVMGNPIMSIDPLGLDETFWDCHFSSKNGRSCSDGPRNGNWGGKNWSGGWNPKQHKGEDGPEPPVDSGDDCYLAHDKCYETPAAMAAKTKKDAIKKCDLELVQCLRKLPKDPTQWPRPPRAGTENDSRSFCENAIWYFK